MKQYKLQTGGNRNIFDILTVHDDGRMTITFHGTDRVITHEAKEQADGRLLSGTSLFPSLSSGKWFETTFTQEPTSPSSPKAPVAETPKAAAPKVVIAAEPKAAIATTQDVYGRLYGSHYDHREKSENKDQKVLLISSLVAAAVFIALVSTVGVFGLATVGILAGSLLKGA